MSIRKNNRQIAGNYSNLSVKSYSSIINKGLDDIINTGNNHLENINQEAIEKISEMNNILDDVTTTGDEKINIINTTGDEKIDILNATGDEKIETINTIVEQLKVLAYKMGVSVIGTEKVWRGLVEPEGYIFMDGQEVSREEYPDLFQWAVDNNLVIEDADWRNLKKYGFYTYGDGSTTFRLPNMTGYYLVGYDPEHHTDLGVEQLDMLPDIKGSLSLHGTNNSSFVGTSEATGVFSVDKQEASNYPITGSTTLTDDLVEKIEFNLSNEFNTGDRVQPRSIPVKYIVCYKNILDDIQIL